MRSSSSFPSPPPPPPQLRLLLGGLMVAMALSTTVEGVAPYMARIPNSHMVGAALGHSGHGQFTEFGKAFRRGGYQWSGVCRAFINDWGMTAGEAMGDPCCKWRKEGQPLAPIERFKDKPRVKILCDPVKGAVRQFEETPPGAQGRGGGLRSHVETLEEEYERAEARRRPLPMSAT